jgi:fluoride exporter
VLRGRAGVLAVISVGGALGSLARWGMSLVVPVGIGGFPWSTVVVNVTGALLIGVLVVLVLDVAPPSRLLRPFLGTGVLGGYTTFSTAMLDLRALLVDGRSSAAAAYLGLSLVLGLLAVWGGMIGTRAVLGVVRRRRRARHLVGVAGAARPPEAS